MPPIPGATPGRCAGMTALVDQEVRDRVQRDLDATVFIEAGAGTGKTTAIVSRIVELVATGRVRMEYLAAITFTESAAAELRNRIREALEVAASSDRLSEEADRCAVAAGEIDLASIQTLHAFAATLLRHFALDAGLPPGFVILDAIQESLEFEERFRRWLWRTRRPTQRKHVWVQWAECWSSECRWRRCRSSRLCLRTSMTCWKSRVGGSSPAR